MVSWGGGLLAFGITLLGVTGLRALQGEIESFYGVQAAFAAASVLGGFLCATCREPLGEMLLDSGVLRWLLVDFIGVRKSSLSVGRAEHSLVIPVAAGILLGLLTLKLRILYLFLGAAAVVGAALILCVPCLLYTSPSTSFCSTSPPTISTSPRASGWRACSRSTRARCSSSRTTATSSAAWPPASSRWSSCLLYTSREARRAHGFQTGNP